jgi:transketolase
MEMENYRKVKSGKHYVCCRKKVDNIISTIDYNGQQIDGDTDDVLSLGNLHAKLEAFGWTVLKRKTVTILKLLLLFLKKQN